MKRLSTLTIAAASIALAACETAARQPGSLPGQTAEFVPPEPIVPWAPHSYVAYRTDRPLDMDGRLDEPAWRAAAWTEDFADIEGPSRPMPRFRTRAKLLWDTSDLYIGAELAEPDVWATLTERDAVIFRDNDFEVFIDPDGDTQSYYELEVNALGTAWDLFLPKAYRDEGHAVNGWDIHGLKVRVKVDGTPNRPGDTDRGWTVELALPWAALRDAANTAAPPHAGDQWRLTFSRVEWRTHVERGRYVKDTDPATGKPFAEDNWLWTPQGVINVHYPEMWGFVQFSDHVAGHGADAFVPRAGDALKWMLRVLYYRERAFHADHGFWTDDLAKLRLTVAPRASGPWARFTGLPWPPLIAVTPDLYEAALSGPGGKRIVLTSDGAVR